MSRRGKRFKNVRPGFVFLLIPVVFGLLAVGIVFSSRYQHVLSAAGASRLTTKNWQTADAAFAHNDPVYQRKFAYYKVQPGQTLASLAEHFSVPQQTLATLNPGAIVSGTTIKVPPVEHALTPIVVNGAGVNLLTTQLIGGVVHVNNSFSNPQVKLDIPTLMKITQAYNALQQTTPKQYRLLLPLYVEGNIRLDITSDTVSQLALKSNPDYGITTLTIRDAELLVKDSTITTVDLATNKPDLNYADGRSFVRAYGNGRMDIINSHMSYLGMSLDQLRDQAIAKRVSFISQGGIYGVSWRIPTHSFGQNIVTGWVQNSTFDHNHIGSFTFGASGMTWEHNLFTKNEVYGLDPHDDSNNALIENNTFANNGKHGFIVSKRCDYNIIRDNVSYGNKLHGFMLHENSAYNLIENNKAYDNTDNYVIYQSNFNTIKNNVGYNARGSNVRINQGATNNFVTGNTLSGGPRGVYLYGATKNTLVKDNDIQNVTDALVTNNAQDVLFTGNTIAGLKFKLAANDRIIFGPNTIDKKLAPQTSK
ncbi:MAG: right-handed parallel beta-helix repeat-containing protein [Candidatus Saccharimonadales bacterium]